MFALTRQEIVLIGITAIWGTTYLIVHTAMLTCGPCFYVGLRFATAGLAAMVLFRHTLSGLTKRELVVGVLIGAIILIGYVGQTMGLKTITSSQSAFLTALFVPLVPLLQWLIFRKPPTIMRILGIIIAFIGLLLLTGTQPGGGGTQGLSFSYGEIITLISTVAFSVQIVLIGYFAPSVDSKRITVVELLFCAMGSFLLMPVTGEAVPAFSWVWFAAAIGLGLATTGIQLAMNWAQKTVNPTRATLIYAGEPVWGGIAGRLGGDRLPQTSLAGAGLIVIAVLISELKIARHRKSSGHTKSVDHTKSTGPAKAAP